MNITAEKIDGITVLHLTGNLDVNCAESFKLEFEKQAQDNQNFVFDLSGVDFIDSSGLGKIVSALKTVAKRKGDIKLACLNQDIYMIFEVTRAHKIFDIYDSVDAAVKGFFEK